MVVILILPIVSIAVSLYALWYSRQQVKIMQAQERARQEERTDEDRWALKFDSAVSVVQKIGPQWTQMPYAQVSTSALVFPDSELVGRIERYLIDGKINARPVNARQLHANELRLPIV